MKVEINSQELLVAITDVYSIVDRRSIKSILANVKITTGHNRMYFYTTDLEIFAKREIKVPVNFETSTTVPIVPFYDIIRGLGDDVKVTLSFESMGIKGEKNSYKISIC
jgi:DNA polymerase III sliding clamp (beta) subunit (PCNA family)